MVSPKLKIEGDEWHIKCPLVTNHCTLSDGTKIDVEVTLEYGTGNLCFKLNGKTYEYLINEMCDEIVAMEAK
ncbi:MAG: hypothetical protein WC375_09985 [Methanomassiliicoccales archaeon]|jgi:hypothetical protein